jgi:predicted RNase H-related nuclease YkuK (DUF458 family)
MGTGLKRKNRGYFFAFIVSYSASTGAMVFVEIERLTRIVSFRQYWMWAIWKLTMRPKQKHVTPIRQ